MNATEGWLLHPIESDGVRIYPFKNYQSQILCTRISLKGCNISEESTATCFLSKRQSILSHRSVYNELDGVM